MSLVANFVQRILKSGVKFAAGRPDAGIDELVLSGKNARPSLGVLASAGLRAEAESARHRRAQADRLEKAIRAEFPRIRHIYIEAAAFAASHSGIDGDELPG
jgi:hypothetical protein